MGSLVKDDVAPAKEQEDPTGITSDLKQVVEGLRNNFEAGLMSMEFRRVQLKRMRDMLLEQTDRFAAATNADLGKPYHEFYVAEVLVTLNELDDMLRNMDSYSADATVSKSQATFMDNLRIQQSPLGVVLIIGAWNYPVSLMLLPALGAIAAGNCVLLKPSEVAPETARAVKEALETYMDQRCCRVVLGGVEETTKLLEERYDHIFFTGSHTVGKIVYQAAAKNLTPCILELGGKNPCYIDSSVDMPKAVRRILGGKTLNAGQTCVAPDYLLCTREVKERFLAQVPEVLREWYPNGTKGSPDYTRLINDRHFQRVKNLIHSGGKIVIGGETDAETRYVAPTIIDYVSLEDPIMKEEVFGPVLPIIEVESVQEALRIVKEREKPLTTYVFSTKDDVINMFKHKTSSGCLVVNETVLHFAVDSLPFGGVGTSGLGKYHGKASFDAFVNKRAILHKSYNPLLEMGGGFRYPPYTNMKLPWARALLLKWWLPLPSRFACAVAALSFVVYQYLQLQNRCETE